MKLTRGMASVVTGAASGLGRSLALQFAARGLAVVLADVEAEPLADAVAGVRAQVERLLGDLDRDSTTSNANKEAA